MKRSEEVLGGLVKLGLGVLLGVEMGGEVGDGFRCASVVSGGESR